MRRQWNFRPPNTMREIEDFRVDLKGITVLELVMCLASVGEWLAPPSRACACLDSLRPCYLSAKLERTGLTRWSLRVAVVVSIITVIVFAVAFVYLFVFFLVCTLAEGKGPTSGRRHGIEPLRFTFTAF